MLFSSCLQKYEKHLICCEIDCFFLKKIGQKWNVGLYSVLIQNEKGSHMWLPDDFYQGGTCYAPQNILLVILYGAGLLHLLTHNGGLSADPVAV